MGKADIIDKDHSDDGDRTPIHEENQIATHLHNVHTQDLSDPDAGKSDEERAAIDKKLLRKLDLKLIPWLTLLYLVSFLDRTNIGNAKIDGLITDLHMTQGQYQASLSIFFVSYSLFEPLTNVLLKKLRPSVFIPAIMLFWGICMTCMGLVHNFSGLATARFFLGMFEAGLFPGVNYYLSCWYKRSEFGIRAAIFFSAAALAGSFGGLLAAGIIQMAGVGGKPGWAWIFILEGLATVIIGIASYWMVHDFPDSATFLSDDDRKRVILRLAADKQGSARHEDFKMAHFWQSLKDWKTYAYSIIYMGADMPLYAFSLFLPTIIREGGFAGGSTTTANLLSVPPYAVAAVLTILVGWYADRTQNRGLANIAVSTLGIAGFAMLLGSADPKVQYGGVFLAAAGIYPCIPNTIAWASNNLEGSYKRGITIGFFVGWGNLNGIVSSNIYPEANSPRYLPGHGVVLGYLAVCLFGGNIVTHFLLEAENKKKKAGKRDYLIEGKSDEEIREIGDRNPSFLYVT
ncbi:putative major facilitator superfamily, MFS transporter superfamily [Septoria linicola]|nr:putative major facilitator superfamily, MFS transporter superfamily [Septoria linicola]